MKMLEQYSTSLCFFSLFSVTVFLCKWLKIRKLVSKNPPPSPPKLPIIGNLHQLGSDPHISLRSLAQKYGPLMLLEFGSIPVLVVSTADAARQIMKTYDLIFSDRPDSSISNRIFYNGKDVALARYSEYWRKVKSTCVMQLLSKKRVDSFRNVREEEVALLIQNIECSHSKIVNLSELFSQLTSSVVCRVALGRKYESEKGISYKKLLGEMTELLGYFRSMGKYIPLLYFVDWLEGLKGKVDKIANEIDAFLEGVVSDHQNAIAPDNTYANKDFVSILLEIQKENIDSDFPINRDCIKSVILDMFFAGTETPSTTLEWTIAALIKNPDVMIKLQDEVRNICKGKPKVLESDLDEMHYLKAVIKESMRLYIPAPLLLPRAAREDVKVMGYDIKSGTQVLVNVWAIARDPSLWDNPEEFRPERFLNSRIDYKGLHYEYLPFGAGRRSCPGIRFAMVLNELAIANVVHKFDFKLPDGERMVDLDMTGVTGITVHKKFPLLVIAKPHV
ncbi:psoralen synthase-like [Apium graveolens]|uniref:psoralen synthase-like n=1 Tax=Apium graveolens TaxID=4045 RepID=UPI003D7C0D24